MNQPTTCPRCLQSAWLHIDEEGNEYVNCRFCDEADEHLLSEEWNNPEGLTLWGDGRP